MIASFGCSSLMGWVWLLSVCTFRATAVPRPVGASYPFLEKVSSFLAERFETEHLVNAALQATDFIMVAALAEETSADVVSKEEERMPFGGFNIPVESEQYEHGRLYILCGIVETKPAGQAISKMNPWPEWQLICGKIFRTDGGKMYSIRYVTPPLEDVELVDKDVNSVIQAAAMDLNQLPAYQARGSVHTLAAVISLQRQVVDQKYFQMLALTRIPHDVKLFYLYFLTEDDQSSSSPATPHAAAVMFSEKTGLKLVRQITIGEPGFTIMQAKAILPAETVFEFTAKKQKDFAIAVAKAIGHKVSSSDIEITDIGEASLDSAEDRRLTSQTRSGVYVTFTLSIAGSGTAITKILQAPGFVQTLQAALNQAGIGASSTTNLQFTQTVVHPNRFIPPPSGLTVTQLVALMGSFVAGVLITTLRASQLRVRRS